MRVLNLLAFVMSVDAISDASSMVLDDQIIVTI